MTGAVQGRRADVAAAGAVCLAGWLCLAMPFWGDQAIFTLYAREITQGAVLYRDVFDVKQPGIFMFYAAGGLLFGFTEVGIHSFELAYWLVFAVFAFVSLRAYFTPPWGASLVPVFTVGAYYCFAGLLDLGQIEALVGFPLIVSWWLIDRAEAAPRRAVRLYAAAGVVAAAVVLLKHLYLLVILTFLARATWQAGHRGRLPSALVGRLVAFAFGLLVPLIPVVLYFWAQGQLGRIWWAYVEMAPAAQLLTPRPIEYLFSGARRFMIGWAPLLILAVPGSLYAIRRRGTSQRELALGMLLWLAAAVVAFPVLQGWPEYKWSIFAFPVGVLAAIGAEAIAGVARRLSRTAVRASVLAASALALICLMTGFAAPRLQTRLLVVIVIGGVAGVAAMSFSRGRPQVAMFVTLAAALGVATGVAAIAPAHKVRLLSQHHFALTAGAREQFQYSLNGAYRDADEDLARLNRGTVRPGPIYVFGDPVVYLRAKRSQAVPILGWGPEFLDRRAWTELDRDLRATLPPYIVITDYAASVTRTRCPAILQLVQSRYSPAFVGGSGTWYVLR